MTNQQIVSIAIETVEELRGYWWIPYDTGNMALNSLRYKWEGKYFIIYFDTTIAPYIPYTNEPWISPKWHGKKNPNENWWEDFAQEFIRRFNAKIGGKIK